MNLTKEQRHQVYIRALDLLRNCIYMCCCIQTAEIELFDNDNNGHCDEYPEFIKHKPDDSYVWFPRNDLESRIKILTQCIEETTN